MSKQVEYWSEEPPYERVLSKREYDTFDNIVGTSMVNDGYWGDRQERASLTLHVDPATGLFVADVAAYEKWIEGQ